MHAVFVQGSILVGGTVELFGGFHVRKIFLTSVAVFAFSAAGHADELSDIQAQSKQLREQNQALAKRLADLEKRQQKIEKQQPAVASGNLAEAMAADLPYKAAVKAPAPANDDLCWHGVCLYGNIDMGLNYQNHGAPLSPLEHQVVSQKPSEPQIKRRRALLLTLDRAGEAATQSVVST